MEAHRHYIGKFGEIILVGGSGHGSTDTKIRRFTSVQSDSASDCIDYDDGAANGATFSILRSGLYAIDYSDCDTHIGSSGDPIGLSLNSAQLTTNIQSIDASNRLAFGVLASDDSGIAHFGRISGVWKFAVGDVIRAHTNGAPDSTSQVFVKFAIRHLLSN